MNAALVAESVAVTVIPCTHHAEREAGQATNFLSLWPDPTGNRTQPTSFGGMWLTIL